MSEPASPSATGPTSQDGADSSPPRPAILVVDDEADVRLALEMTLKYEDYEVWTAKSGKEALARLDEEAETLGLTLRHVQSDLEGELVQAVHAAVDDGALGILVNAAAYTHTSIALLDAIKAITTPVVEVHLSDPKTRESFRHLSYVGMAAAATVEGHGADSYLIALDKIAAGEISA